MAELREVERLADLREVEKSAARREAEQSTALRDVQAQWDAGEYAITTNTLETPFRPTRRLIPSERVLMKAVIRPASRAPFNSNGYRVKL